MRMIREWKYTHLIGVHPPLYPQDGVKTLLGLSVHKEPYVRGPCTLTGHDIVSMGFGEHDAFVFQIPNLTGHDRAPKDKRLSAYELVDTA